MFWDGVKEWPDVSRMGEDRLLQLVVSGSHGSLDKEGTGGNYGSDGYVGVSDEGCGGLIGLLFPSLPSCSLCTYKTSVGFL